MELPFSTLSFHTVLSGRESVTVCSPHLKRGEPRSTSFAGEYLSTWIIWNYSAWELSLLPHLLINSITYLHQHRIMASYFILCVMILNHFMLLLKCFWLWSSGARSVGFCVPWTPLRLCTCFFSFFFFHIPTFWHWLRLQAHLMCFLPQSLNSLFLQGALIPVIGNQDICAKCVCWCWDSKISLNWQGKEMYVVYITCLCTCIYK